MSMGTYPTVSLKKARAKRDEARKQLTAGIDPSAVRKAMKAARGGEDSLEAVSREWHAKHENLGRVFRYAIATGRAERDPAADLRGALPPAKEKHHAAITDPKAIRALLRAIDGYRGSFVTQCAWHPSLSFGPAS